MLKDETGRERVDERQTNQHAQNLWRDCHDYDFIANSFHFQQGKNDMDRALLDVSWRSPFNTSPGMFGKFSIIPNRQLTRAESKTPRTPI